MSAVSTFYGQNEDLPSTVYHVVKDNEEKHPAISGF